MSFPVSPLGRGENWSQPAVGAQTIASPLLQWGACGHWSTPEQHGPAVSTGRNGVCVVDRNLTDTWLTTHSSPSRLDSHGPLEKPGDTGRAFSSLNHHQRAHQRRSVSPHSGACVLAREPFLNHGTTPKIKESGHSSFQKRQMSFSWVLFVSVSKEQS